MEKRTSITIPWFTFLGKVGCVDTGPKAAANVLPWDLSVLRRLMAYPVVDTCLALIDPSPALKFDALNPGCEVELETINWRSAHPGLSETLPEHAQVIGKFKLSLRHLSDLNWMAEKSKSQNDWQVPKLLSMELYFDQYSVSRRPILRFARMTSLIF